METDKKIFRYNLIAIVCGIIFLSVGWIWTYFLNLFIAYPFGLVGLFFWNKGRSQQGSIRLNNIALSILITGLVVSLSVLFFYR